MESRAMLHPTANDVLASPCTRRALKVSLQAFLQADPVDALNDAEILVAVLKNRCDAVFAQALGGSI